MPKMIYVRGVPERVHRILKSRAAREGMSLSDFIKSEREWAAKQSSLQEWLGLTQRAKPISTRVTSARVIREMRDQG